MLAQKVEIMNKIAQALLSLAAIDENGLLSENREIAGVRLGRGDALGLVPVRLFDKFFIYDFACLP